MTFGDVELHFRNRLHFDRPKCKIANIRQTLRFQWEIERQAKDSVNVSCLLLPLEHAELMVTAAFVSTLDRKSVV